MLRILLAALATALCVASAAAAPLDRRELRAGVATNQPPLAYVDEDGAFRGIAVEVARASCRRLQVRCSLVAVDVFDPVPPLQSRAVDFIPAVAITEALRRALDFTERYYRAPARLVTARGRGLEPSSQGLAERTVGVQRGTAGDRYATANFARSSLRRYPDQAELFLDLALGRLDAALSDVIGARSEFLDTEVGAGFEFAGPALDDPVWFGDGIGIAVRRGDERLRAALDGALRDLRQSGVLEAIRGRYVGFAID